MRAVSGGERKTDKKFFMKIKILGIHFSILEF